MIGPVIAYNWPEAKGLGADRRKGHKMENENQISSWLNDPKRYVDLGKYFMKQESFMDWEGFADPDEVMKVVQVVRREAGSPEEKERHAIARTLLTHWVHQNIDQGGYTPTQKEAEWAFDSFDWLLGGCRWFMKEDAK